MRTTLLCVLLLFAGAVHADVVHVPIKSKLVLSPNQAYTVAMDTADSVEIGWLAVQAKPCATNCIEMSDLTTPGRMGITTSIGASKAFVPAGGKISIEFKNVSSEPVTIDIFRVKRTCNAEACKFLDRSDQGRFLVYKIVAFKSIATSKDESYSVISGTALSGRGFTVRAVWWSDDPHGFRFGCAKWIKGWIDQHAPPEKYSPYILGGHATGDGNNIVLSSIDSCVPLAPHYGVSEANVFK